MRYIDSWLTGLGLEYIIPKLKANGITTPKKLAQLTLRDMYDVVGVEDAEDRKKLYFLIQRLHTVNYNAIILDFLLIFCFLHIQGVISPSCYILFSLVSFSLAIMCRF